MTETQKLPVNRDEIFRLASQILDDEAKVPSLGSLRGEFETPSSPAIAVYFSEWKAINADKIAQIKRTPAQMRDYAMRLQGELADISTRYKALEKEFKHFNQFIQENHPLVLSEWDNYRLEQ